MMLNRVQSGQSKMQASEENGRGTMLRFCEQSAFIADNWCREDQLFLNF